MDEIIYEKVLMNEKVSSMSVSDQSEFLRIFEQVLEEIVKEKPNARIQSLLDNTTE